MSEDKASDEKVHYKAYDERFTDEDTQSEEEEEEMAQGRDIEDDIDGTKTSNDRTKKKSHSFKNEEDLTRIDTGSEQDESSNESKSLDSSVPEEYTEKMSESSNDESNDGANSDRNSNEGGKRLINAASTNEDDEHLADLDDNAGSESEENVSISTDEKLGVRTSEVDKKDSKKGRRQVMPGYSGSAQHQLVDDSNDEDSSCNKKKRTWKNVMHKGLAPLDVFASEEHYLRVLKNTGHQLVRMGQNPLRRAYGVRYRTGQDPLSFIANAEGEFKTSIREDDRTEDLSSSEESSEEEHVPVAPIDWTQADYGGKESLFEHLKASDAVMGGMVGWATFLKADKSSDPHNPLLGLPNTPLPPEILEYITDQVITCQSKSRFAQRGLEWRKQTYLARKPEKKRHKWDPAMHFLQTRRLNKHKAFWKYNSDDETYQWLKANVRTTNMIDIMTPFPYTGRKISKHIPLDISGQVALGMAIEDIITASLFRLAKRHVENCREKEKSSGQCEIPPGERRHEMFSEWTLPPEEAILASEGSTPLLSAMPVTGNSPDPMAVLDWCRSRRIDPLFVRANMDVYSKILPCPPKAPAPDVLPSRNTEALICDLKECDVE